MRASSVASNSLGVRKSSAVPIKKQSLHASFNDGTAAAAGALTAAPARVAEMAARKSRREIVRSYCFRISGSCVFDKISTVAVAFLPTGFPEIHEAFFGRMSRDDGFVQIYAETRLVGQSEAALPHRRTADDSVAHPRFDHIVE